MDTQEFAQRLLTIEEEHGRRMEEHRSRCESAGWESSSDRLRRLPVRLAERVVREASPGLPEPPVSCRPGRSRASYDRQGARWSLRTFSVRALER